MNERVAKAIATRQQAQSQLGDMVPVTLAMGEVGRVESIGWVEHDEPELSVQVADTEVVVDVRAIGLTTRDNLVASGPMNEIDFGNECTGIVSKAGKEAGFQPGQRVCVLHDSIAQSRIRVPSRAVMEILDDMSFPVAAYCLVPYGWPTMH
jgi:NADPH:quinone reductase-like Zn-dependent oxidoreductase